MVMYGVSYILFGISMIFLIFILNISLLLFISHDKNINPFISHFILINKKIIECDIDILVSILYGDVSKKVLQSLC